LKIRLRNWENWSATSYSKSTLSSCAALFIAGTKVSLRAISNRVQTKRARGGGSWREILVFVTGDKTPVEHAGKNYWGATIRVDVPGIPRTAPEHLFQAEEERTIQRFDGILNKFKMPDGPGSVE
jgi:hypothetical protein